MLQKAQELPLAPLYTQSHGEARYVIPAARRELPDTYIVHSICRATIFPNKIACCFVCKKCTPWSGKCQIKLKRDGVSLKCDKRKWRGPAYHGPRITSGNAEDLWKRSSFVTQ